MTVIFFLSVAVLACIAIAFIVPIVLRETTSETRTDRRQKNIDVAKQRLEDLKRSEEAGITSTAESERIKKEIERGLLDDLDDVDTVESVDVEKGSTRVRQWTAIAAAVLIPVSAGLLYLMIGEPRVISNPEVVFAPVPEALEEPGIEIDGQSFSFEEMTTRVLTHLAENPEDVEGWSTLSQLYVAQQMFSEAAAAYRKLRELSGDNADLLVREADAMAMANDGDLGGEPESLILAALELDPNHGSALWLAGIAAASRGDFQTAIGHWKKAETVLSNEEVLLEIERLIAGAEAELASSGQPAEVAETESEKASASVSVSVSIDPSILQQVEPEHALFVFARAAAGPPMPLAVVRKQVKDSPLTVQLDDSLAMMENLQMSGFEEVMIVARISLTGTPVAQSGDYFGEIGPVRPRDMPEVAVSISEQVP